MSIDCNVRIVAEMSEQTEKIFAKAKEIINFYDYENIDKLKKKFYEENGFEDDFFNSIKDQWDNEWGYCTDCWSYSYGKNYFIVETSKGYPNAFLSNITNELEKYGIKYSCDFSNDMDDYDLEALRWFDGTEQHEATTEERDCINNRELKIIDVCGMVFNYVDYDELKTECVKDFFLGGKKFLLFTRQSRGKLKYVAFGENMIFGLDDSVTKEEFEEYKKMTDEEFAINLATDIIMKMRNKLNVCNTEIDRLKNPDNYDENGELIFPF